jgi:hypothetical protein
LKAGAPGGEDIARPDYGILKPLLSGILSSIGSTEPMTFPELMKKLFDDNALAALAVKDPAAALKQCGIEPTAEKVHALREATVALLVAHSVFSGSLKIDNI